MKQEKLLQEQLKKAEYIQPQVKIFELTQDIITSSADDGEWDTEM